MTTNHIINHPVFAALSVEAREVIAANAPKAPAARLALAIELAAEINRLLVARGDAPDDFSFEYAATIFGALDADGLANVIDSQLLVVTRLRGMQASA